MEDGWVLVEDDDEQVSKMIEECGKENENGVDAEELKKRLKEVEKVAFEIDPEKVEYVELDKMDNNVEEEEEGFVVVQSVS